MPPGRFSVRAHFRVLASVLVSSVSTCVHSCDLEAVANRKLRPVIGQLIISDPDPTGSGGHVTYRTTCRSSSKAMLHVQTYKRTVRGSCRGTDRRRARETGHAHAGPDAREPARAVAPRPRKRHAPRASAREQELAQRADARVARGRAARPVGICRQHDRPGEVARSQPDEVERVAHALRPTREPVRRLPVGVRNSERSRPVSAPHGPRGHSGRVARDASA